jgi:hypothetical protein
MLGGNPDDRFASVHGFSVFDADNEAGGGGGEQGQGGVKGAGPYPWTDESFMRSRHARPFYALLTAIWGVARPQGGRFPAVFFPLGYPFPYGSGERIRPTIENERNITDRYQIVTRISTIDSAPE